MAFINTYMSSHVQLSRNTSLNHLGISPGLLWIPIQTISKIVSSYRSIRFMVSDPKGLSPVQAINLSRSPFSIVTSSGLIRNHDRTVIGVMTMLSPVDLPAGTCSFLEKSNGIEIDRPEAMSPSDDIILRTLMAIQLLRLPRVRRANRLRQQQISVPVSYI